MENGGYMNILAAYPSSIFQDFESYLRTEIDLVEDENRLVWMIIIQVFLLMKYNQVFTLFYQVFPELFFTFSNLNIQHLAAKLFLNLMILT